LLEISKYYLSAAFEFPNQEGLIENHLSEVAYGPHLLQTLKLEHLNLKYIN
jgi:hypothetical protein